MSKAVEWRDIPGYEGSYQVSRCGRVRSLDRVITQGCRWGGTISYTRKGVELAPQKTVAGYLFVQLGEKNPNFVHRLVALVFLENPNELPVVDHRNGDQTHNHADNLRWATRKLNSYNRAYSHGKAVGVLGVSRTISNTNPYRASIYRDGKHVHLGVFPTIEAASEVYQKALNEVMSNV